MHRTRGLRVAGRPAGASERGFTLIEVMVVVLIIGILAAIAVPVFLGAVDQARGAAVESELTSARLELASALVADGELIGAPIEAAVIDTNGDPNVTLTLWATATEFCLLGEHANLSDSWAASRHSAPVMGAGCTVDGAIVLP